MVDIVLFHSVLGVRPGITDAAERWRAAGHEVHVPDLYEGRVFYDYDPAFDHLDAIGGLPELFRRTEAALAGLPAGAVYAGVSNGVMSAEYAVANRPGARAALLIHGAVPLRAVGAEVWPSSVPVQVHEAEFDPFREPEVVDEFAEQVSSSGAAYTYFSYPGVAAHLFDDASLPKEHDEAAAALLHDRTLSFLDQLS